MKYLTFFLALTLMTAWHGAVASSSEQGLETVSLRLPWKHQFQFAGVYAAIEQGYYRERGLVLELKEDARGINNIDEVLAGDSTFGLAHSGVIAHRLAGQPVKLLANYFKRPAMAIVSREGITSFEELEGKRLMISQRALDSPLVFCSLKQAGLVPGKNLQIVPDTHTIEPFVQGEVDARFVYSSNEPFALREAGVPFETLDLSACLPALGSDYLFTRSQYARLHPQEVRAFVEATNEGWAYALDHPQEIIELILEKYAPEKTRAQLEFEAEKVRGFVLPVAFPIGAVFEERIAKVAALIQEQGLGEVDMSRLDGFLLSHEPSLQGLKLSEEEKKWLQEHPVIRTGIDPMWMPVEYFDEQGMPQGISVSYLEYFETQLGVQFEIQRDHSWDEAYSRLESGKLDLLPATSATEQRKARLKFTDPYLSFPINIFAAQKIGYLDGLGELGGKKVAVVQGYAVQSWIERDYPDIELVPAPGIAEALRRVASGENDAYVGNLAVTSFYIGKLGLFDIHVAGETPYRNDLAMAVRGDAPLLASILHKSLKAVPENVRQSIYHNWISIRYNHHVSYRLVWQVLGGRLAAVAHRFLLEPSSLPRGGRAP